MSARSVSRVCPPSVSTTITRSCVSAADYVLLHYHFHDIAYRMDASISIIVA